MAGDPELTIRVNAVTSQAQSAISGFMNSVTGNFGTILAAGGALAIGTKVVLGQLEDLYKVARAGADSAGGEVSAAYDRFDAALDNLETGGKELLANALYPLIAGLIEMPGAVETINKALDEGVISFGDYLWAAVRLVSFQSLFRKDYRDAILEDLGLVNEGIDETIEQIDKLSKAEAAHIDFQSESWDNAMLVSAGLLESKVNASLISTKEHMEASREAAGLLGGALMDMAGDYDAARTAAGLLNEGIKLVSDTMLEQERVKLALKLATEDLTGEEKAQLILQFGELENISALNKAYDDGVISKYDWIEAMSDGMVTTEELAALLGETADEAARGAAELDALGMAAMNASGDYVLNFDVNVTGDQLPNPGKYNPGAKGGGGSARDNAGGGFSHGTDFVVPPGFNNDSFGPIYVESGERVQVTPANQMGAGKGGGGNGPVNVTVLLDGKEIAAQVLTQAGRGMRNARSSGAGLTGR